MLTLKLLFVSIQFQQHTVSTNKKKFVCPKDITKFEQEKKSSAMECIQGHSNSLYFVISS